MPVGVNVVCIIDIPHVGSQPYLLVGRNRNFRDSPDDIEGGPIIAGGRNLT